MRRRLGRHDSRRIKARPSVRAMRLHKKGEARLPHRECLAVWPCRPNARSQPDARKQRRQPAGSIDSNSRTRETKALTNPLGRRGFSGRLANYSHRAPADPSRYVAGTLMEKASRKNIERWPHAIGVASPIARRGVSFQTVAERAWRPRASGRIELQRTAVHVKGATSRQRLRSPWPRSA